jgi:hypothetical protein
VTTLPVVDPETFRASADHRAEEPPAWLDVRAIARVRASSEDHAHRIDDALSADASTHWRAADPGEQLIEVRFHSPRDLTRIRLVFVEEHTPRTQQVTIRWSSRRGETHGEVVRQQFNFSPSGATREIEDYRVELREVEMLQIRVTPDIGSGSPFATLAQLQLA